MRTSVTSGKMTGPALLRAAFGAEAMLLKAPPARATAAEKESSASIGVLAWMSKRGLRVQVRLDLGGRARAGRGAVRADRRGRRRRHRHDGGHGLPALLRAVARRRRSSRSSLSRSTPMAQAGSTSTSSRRCCSTRRCSRRLTTSPPPARSCPCRSWMMYVVYFGVLCSHCVFSLPSSETRHITYRPCSDKSKKCGFA